MARINPNTLRSQIIDLPEPRLARKGFDARPYIWSAAIAILVISFFIFGIFLF